MSEPPRIEGDSRATRIRKLMKKEARLYRSPVRWALFFATMVPALIEFVQLFGGSGTALLGGVVLAIGPAASFGRRRWLRGVLAFVILLAAAVIQRASPTPWTGTILLVAAVGLIGRAIFGPEVILPAASRPDLRRRARELTEARETWSDRPRRRHDRDDSLPSSPLRWTIAVAAVATIAAALAQLPSVRGPTAGYGLSLGATVGLVAVFPAAFAVAATARFMAGLALLASGAAVFLCAAHPLLGTGPVVAGIFLGILPPRLPRPGPGGSDEE
jgi:hypothetical protein